MIKHDGTDIHISGSSVSKNSNTDSLNADNYKGPWEFFKDVHGIITRPMNIQINIPSTAFTPNFALPSKAILSNIVSAKNILSGLAKKAKSLANVIDSTSSLAAKQKQIVKVGISLAYKKFNQKGA